MMIGALATGMSCCARGGARGGFRFTQNGGAFLAADLDRPAADLDGNAGVIEFAVAGGAGVFLHDVSPVVRGDREEKTPFEDLALSESLAIF
jgi:hypothetical protein